MGEKSFSSRTYSLNKTPRASVKPRTPLALRPAALNVWQGGPPIIKSIFPKFFPVNSLISIQLTLECWKRFPSPVLRLRVSQNFCSISTEPTISKPISVNPISKPPAPENKLSVFIGTILLSESHFFIFFQNLSGQAGVLFSHPILSQTELNALPLFIIE